MEQRRLRLGDTLDDYCPRERRITNHVVVAMIDEAVKQTRCSTCDADHEYKQARVPAPRRRREPGALSASATPEALRARRVDVPEDPESTEASDELLLEPPEAAVAETDPEPVPEPDERDDDGPVHRRLIRATLPRPEGQAPERKEPEFTARQPGGRDREVDGNRVHQGQKRHRRRRRGGGPQGDARFGGPSNGNTSHGSGNGSGNRHGQSRHPQRGNQQQPGGHRTGGQGGGEGRFRRRRGR